MKKLLTLACASFSLASCQTLNVDRQFKNPAPPGSVFEAGRVQIAAHPPIVWYDVVDRLDPNFPVTNASTFLNVVAPLAATNLSVSEGSFGAGLSIDAGGTTFENLRESTRERTLPSDGEITEAGTDRITRRETSSSGSIPELEISPPERRAISDSVAAPARDQFQVDPALRYSLAASVYQHVQLLNSYLEAEVARSGMVPFLFRARLSVEPYADNIPYTVYSELYLDHDNVRIIPLVVLDSAISTTDRRLASAARQLEFALAATIQGVGASGALADNQRRLRDLASLNVHSVFLAGQSSSKNFTARIGVQPTPNGPTMVARSYDVSFLVLVDEESVENGEKLDLRQFANMRHSRTGERIPIITNRVRNRTINEIIQLSLRAGLPAECETLARYNLGENAKQERQVKRAIDTSVTLRLRKDQRVILPDGTAYTNAAGQAAVVSGGPIFANAKMHGEVQPTGTIPLVGEDDIVKTEIGPFGVRNLASPITLALGGNDITLPQGTRFEFEKPNRDPKKIGEIDCRTDADDYDDPVWCTATPSALRFEQDLDLDYCVHSNKVNLHSSSMRNAFPAGYFRRFALRRDQELFSLLSDYLNATRQARTSFDLPNVFAPLPTPSASSVAILSDVPSQATIVQQAGFRNVSPRHHELQAELSFSGGGRNFTIQAQNVQVSEDGVLSARFSSITRLAGLTNALIDGAKFNVSGLLDPPDSTRGTRTSNVIRDRSNLRPAQALFNLTVLPNRSALDDNGQGVISASITNVACPPTSICPSISDHFLAISNYPIESVTDNGTAMPRASIDFARNGFVAQLGHTYEVTLKQLVDGAQVAVVGTARGANRRPANANQALERTVTFVGKGDD